MELGWVVGMNGFSGTSSLCGDVCTNSMTSSDTEVNRQKGLFSSGSVKQGKSAGFEDHEWRCLKMARTGSSSIFSYEQQLPMFSSSKAESFLLNSDDSLLATLSPSSWENAGLVSGNLNINVHEVIARAKRPFTPSQWLELEQQALIYKYLNANAPIPSNLLTSIRKGISSPFSTTSLGNNTLRWRPYQLGFSMNTDPEPGRCRRTDGKKWRCSRDAVADQKYCERHMNRNRHRSRKPVEGQTGHARKAVPAIANLPSASIVSGSRSSSISTIHQKNNLQPDIISSPHRYLNWKQISEENMKRNVKDFEESRKLNSVSLKPVDTLSLIPTEPNPCDKSYFSSPSSSPMLLPQELLALSPLEVSTEECKVHEDWIPFYWKASHGGPLGEVLTSSHKQTRALEL
ncbi:growth-regulating factor 7-like isoform X1 [Typha latifolia]|uniref:growth-regulating factor 7-like isoform X1 n=1 Tax=Typha latifolia TaxID=4733 RepID=UPI003C2B02EC